ncbi:OLC1v1023731C1 [Oldenlandia corymbosa var. corymbosa]|uniref:OLC1v1023731C1 n=1 Tax=Oldenlandia corymbosa var. corymbosa TaxID=529605 RepID=A0AAV1C0N0_OLDCO|nr:OLC1v1023731C1 [Oldenlandia corymbosa var. corymbosa]
MLLENMDNKQLNFGRPLLSVRRHSSTVVMEKDDRRSNRSSVPSIPRPPAYKSELKSGPVSNPGTVPFQWERSPGRPKDERTTGTFEEPPAAPKLPPGRVLINQQSNDHVSANALFQKSQDKSPKCSQNVTHLDEHVRETESAQDIKEQAEEGKSESGDDDEVYEDALDSLSRTESFFLNCSVSGISGLDYPDVKPPDTFSTDPQAKEFMIGRFLPAAKAMISETPQYAPPKKQPMVQVEDIPRQLKVVKGDNQPQLRYGPSFARHYAESQYTAEEESDDEYNESENFHGNACGLLPKFCLKSSMCLLNPLPGMSVRTRRAPMSVRRVQARSSSASTCSKTDNELSSFDASEQRSIDGSQTTELFEDKCDVANPSIEISSKSQKLDGSSPYEQSDHPNKLAASIGQTVSPAISSEIKDVRNNGLSLHSKGYKSFRDLLADDRISEELDSGSPAVEKTLYVDTVHKGTSVEQNTCELTNLGEDVSKASTKMAETNLPEDPSLIKTSNNVSRRDVSKTDFHKTHNFSVPPLASKTTRMTENNAAKAFGDDEDLYQDAANSEILLVPVEKATQSLKKNPIPEKQQNYHGINAEFPVPPPLPNSPSDSWLCRTLPSMSSKNASRNSHFGTGMHLGNQAPKPHSGDPKWETIVKATKVHHHHLRYSEVNYVSTLN